MKFIPLLLILIFSIESFFFEHAIYVSVIEVTVVDEKVDVMIKVFEDDLRDALRANTGKIYGVVSHVDSLDVQRYFEEHLIISDKGDIIKLELLDLSRAGDSYQIHMAGIIGAQSVIYSLEADYLMELFSDQKNILHFFNGDQRQFEILDIRKSKIFLK